MGLNLDELKAFLDSDEGKASMEAFFNEKIEQEKIKETFFESEEFNYLISEMKNFLLNEDDWLQSSDYDEFLIESKLSNDDFNRVCESIFHVMESKEDPDANFSTQEISYQQMKFSLICGQGCFYRAQLDERVRKINKIL